MALASWANVVTDTAGNVQAGASVEVRSEVTGKLVPIFSDRDGADPLDNPMTADEVGFFRFHVLGGAYKIVATKGAFTTGDRWRYVGIGTGSESDFGNLFTPQGPWLAGSPATEYNQGDVVSHTVTGSGNYAFLSNQDGNTAEPQFTGSPPEPTSDVYWTVLGVSVTGTKGDTGDQGLPGSSDVVGTSTTSLAIETGAKVFTIVEDDRGWGVGARLRASSDANPDTHWMEGTVASYSANTLTLTVDKVSSSGTLGDWTVNLIGEPGADGAQGVSGASAFERVRVVDISGLDPTTDYEAGDTVDGVTLAENDLVLRAVSGGSPSTEAENGVYVVPSSGASSRHSSFDTFNEIAGAYFSVMEGTTYADTLWRCTSDLGGTLDTDPISVTQFSAGQDLFINVKDYGAVGDGSTDDTAAFNAAATALKALVTSPGSVTSVCPSFLYIPQGVFRLDGSVNLQGIQSIGWGVCGPGVIYANCTGKTVLDCLGSRWGTFKDFSIVGDTTNAPAIGLQIGRSKDTAGESGFNAGEHLIQNVRMWGNFSRAGIYNLAGEDMHYSNVVIFNTNTSTSSWAIITDGFNVFGPITDFTGTEILANTASSCIDHTFVMSSFYKVTSGSAMYFSRSDGVKFVGCYAVADDAPGAVFVLTAEHPTITGLDFDVHEETVDTLTYNLEFRRTASGTITIKDFNLRDFGTQASTAFILFGTNVSGATLTDGRLSYSPTSLTPFAGLTPTVLNTNINGTEYDRTFAAFGSYAAKLVSNDAGAGFGPVLQFDRNSASPAANDLMARFNFTGRDSNGASKTYADIYASIVDPTSGSEDGKLSFRTAVAGTVFLSMEIADGVKVGNPSPNFHGNGTLTASAVYDDSTLLTCMALSQEFLETGTIDVETWDAKVPDEVQPELRDLVPETEEVEVEEEQLVPFNDGFMLKKVAVKKTVKVQDEVPVYDEAGERIGTERQPRLIERVVPEQRKKRQHHTARLFKAMLDDGFDPRDPAQYIAKLKRDSALPGMPTLADWEHNSLSTGELHNRLWLAVEMLALVVVNHEDRIKQLETVR